MDRFAESEPFEDGALVGTLRQRRQGHVRKTFLKRMSCHTNNTKRETQNLGQDNELKVLHKRQPLYPGTSEVVMKSHMAHIM